MFTGSYAINPVNGEADSDLDRRLRADQLRHRRDHGRAGARRARFRVRQGVQAADRAGGRIRPGECGMSTGGSDWPARRRSSATARRSIPANTMACRRRNSSYESPPIWPTAGWAVARSTTNCAIGSSAGSVFGASRFRFCTNWTRTASRPGLLRDRAGRATAGRICRSWPISNRIGQPGAAAGKSAGRMALSGHRRQDATSAKPTRCRNGPARAGTTCGFSTPRTTRRSIDPADRKSLDAGRSVHRRRGTCRAASALLALLAQGAVRPRLREHAGAVSRSW